MRIVMDMYLMIRLISSIKMVSILAADADVGAGALPEREMPKEFLWIYKISSFVGTLFFTSTSVFLIIEKIK